MVGRYADTVRELVDAMNAGDIERAFGFFQSDVVQHDPNMAADAESFRNHLQDLASRWRDIAVVRLLEDGPLVMAQLKSERAGQDRFAVYRFEDEQIAEQWAFFMPVAPPNKSSHTQVDGPTGPQHLEETEANKLFARHYYETFHLAGDRSHNNAFFTGDVMIRHEPGVQDGLGNFLTDVEHLMKQRTIDEIKLLIGQGDLVFIAAAGTHESKPCVYIDLYRIENGKLVEHWGFPQMVPPKSEWKNDKGML